MIFRPEPLYAPQQRVDFHSVLAGLRALLCYSPILFNNFILTLHNVRLRR
jgi:hypothetical protein